MGGSGRPPNPPLGAPRRSRGAPRHRDSIGAVYVAKLARTFCYGFLGVLLPVYLADLGMSAGGVGLAVTLTLLGSATLTGLVRRPAERFGARAALLGLAALTGVAALLLLASDRATVVVLAAVIGNVAVGAGETGPFLTIEQVVVTRAVSAARRTTALSVYNLLGHGAAALGSIVVGLAPPRGLFALFLAAALVQAAAYARLPRGQAVARPRRGPLPSAPLIRRFAALFALDAFAGGFVIQALIAYFLHARFGFDLATLGRVFFVTQALTAISLLVTPWCARRGGLLPTMVVSHLLSNVALVGIAFAPSAALAVGLLFARQLLSQMDVPTRQAYVMAVVQDHEREAAAGFPNMARTLAQSLSPTLTGWVMQAVALSAPFAVGGALKIVYDLLLWWTFRDVTLREEAG